MLKVEVGYNTFDEEFMIVNKVAREDFDFNSIKQVVTKDELKEIKKEIQKIHVDDELTRYMLQIVFASRDSHPHLTYGASPRASIDLFKASRAHAYIKGKEFVTPLDVAEVVYDVLRHRIILNYQALSQNITPDMIIKNILESIKAP